MALAGGSVMKLFERILCPIDFSQDSVKALQWTEYLARKYESEVSILHVMEPYPATVDVGIDYDKYHSAVVRDMENFLAPLTIPHQTLQSSGLPSEKIVSFATTLGASLIVMSTRGLRGAAHKFIGSTAESVIRHSDIPVMTLSPDCGQPGSIDSNRILVPISKLTWPIPGYMRRRRIIRDLDASVTMMYVVDMHDSMFGASFDANPTLVTTYEITERKEDLKRLAVQIERDHETTEAVLQFGDASREILREIETEKYSYVLMGAKHNKLFSRLQNTTAYNVISQSHIPVLAIKLN
jgi:universal stress protein A